MSTVSYNGVSLPYPYVTHFNQEPVYEDSHTDWIGTDLDITVQCVINADYLGMLAPDLHMTAGIDPLGAADVMNVIRSRLLKPRQRLSVKMNGVEMIPWVVDGSVPGSVDSHNGPIPQSCNIFQLTDVCFLMTYRIKARYWERLGLRQDIRNERHFGVGGDGMVGNRVGAMCLYNRWTETVEIDNCNYSTRTREGMFGIRSDNAAGMTVDTIRSSLATLGIPRGFLRQSRRYTSSKDGLSLQYTIVDKEQFKMPPFPAYEAYGYYQEEYINKGAQRIGTVLVRLKGQNDNRENILVQRAVEIAAQKLIINNAATPSDVSSGLAGPPEGTPTASTGIGPILIEAAAGTPVIEAVATATTGPPRPRPSSGFGLLFHLYIKREMYENTVEVMARVLMKQRTARGMGIAALRLDRMNFTPGSDFVTRPGTSRTPPDYPIRGTANLLLQAAAYYDPSLGGSMNSDGQMSRGTDRVNPEPGTTGVYPETP